MGTHPIFESDSDCLTDMNITRAVLSRANYFAVLGMPQTYRIDQTELTQRVRQLQRQAHPDLGGSLELSAEINAAKVHLKSDHKRGLHLLELNEIDVVDNESALDNSFIFEVMELNEEIEEAESVEELKQIYDENHDANQLLVDHCQSQYEKANFDEMIGLLNKIKYRERIQLNTSARLEGMGFFYTR